MAGFSYHMPGAIEALRVRLGRLSRLALFDHQRSHAAVVFLTAGKSEATVVTCDGVGGPYSTVARAGRCIQLRRLDAEFFPNSLGSFYEAITDHLGLGQYSEGTTIGLAAYGDPGSFRDAIAELLYSTGTRWYRFRHKHQIAPTVGFEACEAQLILEGPYADLAASAQDAMQQTLLKIATSVAMDDGTLCLSDGVALNCSANGLLRRYGIARNVLAFAAVGDAGLAGGAALLASARAGETRTCHMGHCYLGPEYADDALQKALEAEPRIRFRRAADVAREAAELIASGAVIGWFQGRMEFGPRALGNRIILADLRRVEVRDQVNRLKGREHWRLRVPSVLLSRASEYFELDAESPFMLFATAVRKSKRHEIPWVTHVDGNARPRGGSQPQNTRYHALPSAFENLTGTPVLMSTSSNGAWEPIVMTPEHAVHTSPARGLDALILGDFITERVDLPVGSRPGADRPVAT